MLEVSVLLEMVPRIIIASNVVHSFADWVTAVCVYGFGKKHYA
uniref:Uncharacterized protein n=1 Tax=Arundo donax TaxID=35708 RepID=A0A0A9C933_ARUDO